MAPSPEARTTLVAPTFWLWPDNLPAWHVWGEVQTQWCYVSGLGGTRATGLNYEGVTAYLRANGWRSGRRDRSLRAMLDDLRALEAGALRGWASKHADRRG